MLGTSKVDPLILNQILTELWDGQLREHEDALQLLYIMDMVAIWAEYTYKPSVCLCLRKLEALVKGETAQGSSNLENEPWLGKLELNRVNFPWLLNPRWNTLRIKQVMQETTHFSIERLSRQEILSHPLDTRKVTKDCSAQQFPQNTNSNRSNRSLSQTAVRGRSDGSASSYLSPDACAVVRSPLQNMAESTSRLVSPPTSEDECHSRAS